jgi:hypothetical protein
MASLLPADGFAERHNRAPHPFKMVVLHEMAIVAPAGVMDSERVKAWPRWPVSCASVALFGPTTPIISLCENAIAKEPGLS